MSLENVIRILTSCWSLHYVSWSLAFFNPLFFFSSLNQTASHIFDKLTKLQKKYQTQKGKDQKNSFSIVFSLCCHLLSIWPFNDNSNNQLYYIFSRSKCSLFSYLTKKFMEHVLKGSCKTNSFRYYQYKLQCKNLY